MRVLALDTSLGAASVAVIDFPGGVIASRSEPMERGHAEALIPMVQAVVAASEGGFAAIHRIVTTVGPGSYTGLRVAVAAARAFGLARKIPVVGVSTLTAYAAPLLAEGSRTTVASAIDARHGSVFFEAFWLDGKVAVPPGLLSIEEAARKLAQSKSRVVGNAAEVVAAAAQAMGLDCEAVAGGPAPDINWVARLGAAANPEYAPARPLYLREASAVPQTAAQVARA